MPHLTEYNAEVWFTKYTSKINLVPPRPIRRVALIDASFDLSNKFLVNRFKEIESKNSPANIHSTAIVGCISMYCPTDVSLTVFDVSIGGRVSFKLWIQALEEATTRGYDLIVCPQSMIISKNEFDSSFELKHISKIIEDAFECGITIFASAGNRGINLDIDCIRVIPAQFPRVTTIGALDKNGKIANYSNFGSFVDEYVFGGDSRSGVVTALASAGRELPANLTTGLKQGLFRYWGTSVAVGIAAGVYAKKSHERMYSSEKFK